MSAATLPTNGSTFAWIRRAEQGDLPGLVALLCADAATAGVTLDPAKVMRGLNLILGHQHSLIRVAERGGHVRALVTLQDHVDVEVGALFGLVGHLAVDADSRHDHVLVDDLLAAVARNARKRNQAALHLNLDHRHDDMIRHCRRIGWRASPKVGLKHDLDGATPGHRRIDDAGAVVSSRVVVRARAGTG